MAARCLFDADGVLIDSKVAAWRAVADIRRLFGNTVVIASSDDVDHAFGVPAQEQLVGPQHASVLRMVHRLVMRHQADKLALFENVLDEIATLPVARAVVTSALADGIARVLGSRAALFDEIVGFETGRKIELLAKAARDSHAIYVTDTVNDVRICREVGLAVIATTWGYDPHSKLRQASPDALVETPAELGSALRAFISATERKDHHD